LSAAKPIDHLAAAMMGFAAAQPILRKPQPRRDPSGGFLQQGQQGAHQH